MKFNLPDARSRFSSRREFLQDGLSRSALLAVLTGAPSLIVTPWSGATAAALPREADVVVIGAGAAGIAAAQRIKVSGRKVLVLEAARQAGGRCVTDISTFGTPFDRGARWLHGPDVNPVARLARGAGVEIYPASSSQRMRIGRRQARASEMEEFLSALVRANRAIDEAAQGKADVAALSVVPKDLEDWGASAAFVLGPLLCGKDLSEISAADYARALKRGSAALCRQGLGTLIARLAADLPIAFETPATRINWSGRALSVETKAGTIACRAIVVTVPSAVLSAGRISFAPELPKRVLDAASNLSLGSFDHVALQIPGNPFDLERDDLIIEKADGTRTAALAARIGGSDLYTVELAGSLGRDLSVQGEAAMEAFAREWVGKLFGSDSAKLIGKVQATRWNHDPLIGGAFSVAKVGAQGARKILMEPLGALHFAGEAAHETQWGTVGGAWESGVRAAEGALRRIGALAASPEEKPAAAPKQRRRRTP